MKDNMPVSMLMDDLALTDPNYIFVSEFIPRTSLGVNFTTHVRLIVYEVNLHGQSLFYSVEHHILGDDDRFDYLSVNLLIKNREIGNISEYEYDGKQFRVTISDDIKQYLTLLEDKTGRILIR